MSERTLLLGYDLGDEVTQLAVYNRETKEPEFVGQTEENPDALYQTAVELNNGEQLTDFMKKIRQRQDIVVDGKVIEPEKVLAFYFSKTLVATRIKYPHETIRQLVVTLVQPDKQLVDCIYQALEQIGIGRDRAVVMGYQQSFLYYAMSREKELWINDVGLFDYTGERLLYYQMRLDRRKKPVLVAVEEQDYSEAIDTIQKESEHKDAVLENVIYRGIHKQILSALYMTGDGFLEEWTEPVLQRLCVGRRVFRGGNLYAAGACYAANELGGEAQLSDYLLMDPDMIASRISMNVYRDAKQEELVFAKAGTPWYQVDASWDLIPQGETELAVSAKNVFSGEERKFILPLDPVAGKTNGQCRLNVKIRFQDVHTLIITIRDLGFGEFFPTSNRVWEKTVAIDG